MGFQSSGSSTSLCLFPLSHGIFSDFLPQHLQPIFGVRNDRTHVLIASFKVPLRKHLITLSPTPTLTLTFTRRQCTQQPAASAKALANQSALPPHPLEFDKQSDKLLRSAGLSRSDSSHAMTARSARGIRTLGFLQRCWL